MAIDFEVVEHRPVAGPDLTLVKVEFRPVPGGPVHSNIFKMQLWPAGRRLLIDGLGRLVTESGIVVPPLPDQALGFPDENPADPFRRVDFARNNDAEMVANIEAYWERKLRAADEGRPYPQHHNTTLNLQVGASSDDADEVVSSGSMDLTDSNSDFGSVGIPHHIGFRWTSVSGLSGRTIDSATLTFRASTSDTGDFVADWFAHDAEAPGTFTTTTSDISDRTRTTATCEGDGVDFGNWTGGQDETFTGDGTNTIADIIQELADSYDPSAIVLLHIYTSGSGERIALTWDIVTDTAAKLDIDHSAGGVTTRRYSLTLTGVG